MLKLNASFMKKVPVEGQSYSSQSYHASVEMELPDANGDVLKAKIHDAFAMVRQTVEEEITGNGNGSKVQASYVTTATAGIAPSITAIPSQATGPMQEEKCSTRQAKYGLDLARSAGITITQLNECLKAEFNVSSIYDLTRKQASRLVDMLKRDRRAA